MIVFLIDAAAIAVLALAVWVLNGAHLPVGLLHTLTTQVLAALAFIITTTETRRTRGRHAAANHRAGGDPQ